MAAGRRCSVGRSASKGNTDGGGGFYKCEECSSSFNRMASYEAHIRMHAQEEMDVLDIMLSYTAAESGRESAGKDKTVRRNAESEPSKSQSPPKTPRSLLPKKPPPPSGGVNGHPTLKLVELLLSDTKRPGGTNNLSCVPSMAHVALVRPPVSSSSGHQGEETATQQLTSKGRWTL